MCTLVQALRLCTDRTVHRGSRGITLLFLDHGTRRGEGSASHPGRSLPPGKTRYPLYRRLGGHPGWSDRVRKISLPPGFDPRTSQPVAQSLYRLSYRAHHKDVLRNRSAGVVKRMNRKANGHEIAVINRLENGEHQAASCLTEILKRSECDNMGLQSATRKPRAVLYGWRSHL